MHDTATLVLAIFGAAMLWTTSVIGGMLWLNTKFRSVETTIYRELDKRRAYTDGRFRQHDTKIQRLEIKAFGFTGPNVEMAEDGSTFPAE